MLDTERLVLLYMRNGSLFVIFCSMCVIGYQNPILLLYVITPLVIFPVIFVVGYIITIVKNFIYNQWANYNG